MLTGPKSLQQLSNLKLDFHKFATSKLQTHYLNNNLNARSKILISNFNNKKTNNHQT
jgi:hypothetical protein